MLPNLSYQPGTFRFCGYPPTLVLLSLLIAVAGQGYWAKPAAARALAGSSQLNAQFTAQVVTVSTTPCPDSNMWFTTATVQSDRTVPALASNTAVLCLTPTVTLGQRIWEDRNGNGQQEGDEPGLLGVTVQLRSSTGTLLQSTVSATDGSYSFTNLATGSYRIQVLRPVGYQFTLRNQGTVDTADSDVDPTTGLTPVIELTSALGSRTWAAGLFRPVTIGDRIWEDVNGNGVQDSGEPGLAGMTVQLFNSQDTLIASTITAADGAYTFQGLPPGDYYLLVIPPTTP